MPDLDSELATVRAETRAILLPPDLDHVVGRSDRQLARRRSVLAFAAVAVVLAIVVPLLQARAVTPAGLKGNVVAIDFADPAHGFALVTDCSAKEIQSSVCQWRLEATRDGATWLPRTAPPLTGVPGVRLQALGKQTVVLTDTSIRWFSKDGARSWQRLPDGLASPVDSIPAGAQISIGCSEWTFSSCDRRQVLVTLPESGAVAPLVNQPPMEMTWATAQPVPAADGSWWVYWEEKTTSRMTLATSRDDGRTWQISHPPGNTDVAGQGFAHGAYIDGIVVVSGNGVLYGLACGPSSAQFGPTGGYFAFYRSADGGRTWELLHQATMDAAVRSVSPTPVITSAGDIVVSTPDSAQHRALISKDGGRSFQPVAQPALDWVSWTRGGYVNTRTGQTSTHWLSTDGITWRKLGES